MNDLDKLKGKLEYHKNQIAKIQTAIEVLSSIDDIGVANASDHQSIINQPSVPADYDESWTHTQRTAFFLTKIGRCAFPKELTILYKAHGVTIKDTMINQILTSMKKKGIVKSYRTGFDAKAHAWGLIEWFNGDKPFDQYKAIKPEKTLWD